MPSHSQLITHGGACGKTRVMPQNCWPKPESGGIVEPGKCKGRMSTRGYEDELRSERGYVAGLYARLDAERARVKGRYSAALRGPIDVQDGGTLVDRDALVRALAKQMKRLDVADS